MPRLYVLPHNAQSTDPAAIAVFSMRAASFNPASAKRLLRIFMHVTNI